jgi:hypothetical protein
MKSTNLRPYSIVLLALGGTLLLACSSSKGSSDGSGGASGDGNEETGGSKGNGGASGSSGSSGFDAGTDPNRNKVTAGSICQRVAEIQCAGEAFCCSMPMEQLADCETAQKMACSQTLSLDVVAMDPVTGFDMAKASAALEKFENLASKCDTTISAFGISLDGFRGIAAGTVAAGGTCNPSSTASNKVAASAAALVSCTDAANNSCLPAPTGMDWKCAPRADAAGKCFSDANCKDGMFCDNPNLDPAGGPCTMRKAAGADCMASNECSSLACVDGKCVTQTKDTAYCLKTASN